MIYYKLNRDADYFYAADDMGLCYHDINCLAESCADNYHSLYGGKEDEWPIMFNIYSKKDEDSYIGSIKVNVEVDPEFIAIGREENN